MNIPRKSNRNSIWKYFAFPLLFTLAPVAGLSRCVSAQDIKYSQDPDAAKHMTLLLRDYDPRAMLHSAVHEVPRAKFPVIDVHNHVNRVSRRSHSRAGYFRPFRQPGHQGIRGSCPAGYRGYQRKVEVRPCRPRALYHGQPLPHLQAVRQVLYAGHVQL